jgi:hypothetical protein
VPSDPKLMAGVFLAPIAAAVNFEINYMIVPFACQTGHRWVLGISPVVALTIAAAGLSMAWSQWKAAGGDWPDEQGGAIPRSRFLGMFGILFSALSCALILMQLIPIFLMSPCVG